MAKVKKTKTTKRKAKKAAAPKGEGRKQLQIAGTERRDANPEIETDADDFTAKRGKFATAREAMTGAKLKLGETMAKHKLTEYVYVDDGGVKRIVEVKDTTKITVSKEKDDEDEDGN